MFSLNACTNTVDKSVVKPEKDSSYIVSSTLNNNSSDSLELNDYEEIKDSLNFHIVRSNYVSGAIFSEEYDDNLTKIKYCKEFYNNGQIKKSGRMISHHTACIGTWKYYSINGDLDSIHDFEKQFKISYFDALNIAEKKGYRMPNIEIWLSRDYKSDEFWNVALWNDNNHHSGQTTDVIFINAKTGKTEIYKTIFK